MGKENVPKTLDAWQNLKYNSIEEYAEIKNAYRYMNANFGADLKAYKCASELKQLGVKGSIHIPKKAADVSLLRFDDKHINVIRKHNVSEAEAKQFITKAALSITKRDGLTENYYSSNGVVYVNPAENLIKTAFKKEEFSGDALIIAEVIKKYGY